MGLSSNSIIHFTKSKESLKGILRDNFKISYCLESIYFDDNPLEYAVPMVSFCDIPLSEVKQHITKYGAYGIGLTKEWASRQKMNPVLYVERYSLLANSYMTFYNKYLTETKKVRGSLELHEKCVVDILRYIKNYQNDLIRGGQVIKNYRFSDEREWRYVLDYNETSNFILTDIEYRTEEQKSFFNSSLEKYRLEFTPNDIKYVIIESEHEIPEFVDILRSSKGNKYTYNDVERLLTRLITTEQIVQDF
jgi:hypothetical protein